MTTFPVPERARKDMPLIVCTEAGCGATAVPRRRPGPGGTPRGGTMLVDELGKVEWECPHHPGADCRREERAA